MENKKKNMADLWLIGACVIIGIGLLVSYAIFARKGDTVIVKVEGIIVAEYAFSENGEYRIETPDGGYNLLKIENNEAYLLEANCPDRLCVGMGKIRTSGQSIICLPHRVVIEVALDKAHEAKDNVDGVAR